MAKASLKDQYLGTYEGARLNKVAFPMGGIGAGMICLEGTGALSHVSLRHKPEVFNEPLVFAAVHVKGASARVLEGPVPHWKAFGPSGSANGLGGRTWGLPRFRNARFSSRFPFATLDLSDPDMPVTAQLIGWSPFIPNDPDNSSLPVAALEYRLVNRTNKPVSGVFSFHSANFMRGQEKTGASVSARANGFVLSQAAQEGKPALEGHFAAFTDAKADVDCAWFRGSWFDPLTMVWNNVAAGKSVAKPPHAQGEPGNGASLYVRFSLKPRAQKTIRVMLAWYVPMSDLRTGPEMAPAEQSSCCGEGCACQPKPVVKQMHEPWYAGRFANISEVAAYWREQYQFLRDESQAFSDCFFDTDLPAEAIESIACNLAILKSPTCLRQKDGRFWAWEGCCDGWGCCNGTCTHVWNYAQAMPHLFPALERTMREIEFNESQDDRGHQNFRASLPVRPTDHDFHAAADGQLGGIMKVYREWRISGDSAWLKDLWPRIRQSLDYCIATWDPDHTGTTIEPHHNTYDIEFWGADGMCTSFYLGALSAGVQMGQACGDDVSLYEYLLNRGKKTMEKSLWNGDYFYQKVQWKGLRAGDPTTTKGIHTSYTPEALVLLNKEGPKYQYGKGCLSDGVLGDWLARCCGVPTVLDDRKITSHLASVFAHNFREDLSAHANPQRPTYAFGAEGGLLLCSWPKGGKPALPFVYSDEVWTGIEYQVASHLIMMGRVKEGLAIVRAVRGRYNGEYRNPFNEYECGHWYARAMSSYALIQAFTGARYDAVEKVLYLSPAIKGDFRAFLCTAGGYGTVGIRKGKPFFKAVRGNVEIREIKREA